MLERVIQNKIITYLKKVSYVIKVTQASENGVSDVIICYKGLFIAFELKRKGKKATPLQARNLRQIITNGGLASVARSVEDVKKVLENIKGDLK